ncbi:MAG: hypothetical protein AAFZ05_00315 [Pseudomonadota bacterium]
MQRRVTLRSRKGAAPITGGSIPLAFGEPEQKTSLEAELRRFDPLRRRTVRKLVRTSDRMADIVRTFPAVAHAIADPDPPNGDAISEAAKRIESGAPLKSVSASLGLPYWLRWLPPDAFRGALPDLPDTPGFTRRIASRLPRHRRWAHPWMEHVAFANRAAGEQFALWVAERPELITDRAPQQSLRVLALYAWASLPEHQDRFGLVRTRWRPSISTTLTLCAAISWLNRIDLLSSLGEKPLVPWLQPGTSAGFEILPLLTAAEIMAEARAMSNCIDQYARPLASGACQLYSVRADGHPIATLEVCPHAREHGVLAINQLKGLNNEAAPAAVWRAAWGWLSQQPDRNLKVASLERPEYVKNAELWRELFALYHEQRPDAAWWPQSATRVMIEIMRDELRALARSAGVVSWLFR